MRGSKTVHGALDTSAAAVEHVSVYHRGADVIVTEQFLYGADVVARHEQFGGEGMTQGVGRGVLRQACLAGGQSHGLLNHRLVHVMAMQDSGFLIHVVTRRREDVLPSPMAVRVEVLPAESVWQRSATKARRC